MENKIDYNKFGLIEEVAIRKSTYLRFNYTYNIIKEVKEEASFYFLRRIISGNDEDIIERINTTYSNLRKAHQTTVVIRNISFNVYHLVWARLCVIAYFFYHDNALWQDFIFSKLEEKIVGESLARDVKNAKVEIDKYHRDIKDYADACKKIQQGNTTMTEPEHTISSNIENTDDLPCLIKIMQDIQDGKIRNLNKVNWVEGIQEMVRLGKLMPAKFPPVCWLWVVSGIIEEPTKRMDVLGKMQEVASQCFNSKKEESEFVRDCDSLVKINGRIREYYLRNDTDKSAIWKGEKRIHDGLAHLLADKYVSPKEMVAIAEQSCCSVQNKEKPQILTLILRADQYVNRMSMDNILDFSKNLYLAEGFRQLFLSGKDDYFDFPTISSFNRKIRNACFDVYIDLRIQQIREELDKDNTRIDDPDDLECLETLLEDEKMIADRENLFEGFRGSSAYEAMWYPGREMVLKLINVFVEYLQKKVNQKRNVIEAPRGSIYYNVHGDIVQGDKRIGTVVKNVEKGGIGVQTNEK